MLKVLCLPLVLLFVPLQADRMDGGLPDIAAVAAAAERSSSSTNSAKTNATNEDIMSVLLAHERPAETAPSAGPVSAAEALGIKSESLDNIVKAEPGKVFY